MTFYTDATRSNSNTRSVPCTELTTDHFVRADNGREYEIVDLALSCEGRDDWYLHICLDDGGQLVLPESALITMA